MTMQKKRKKIYLPFHLVHFRSFHEGTLDCDRLTRLEDGDIIIA